MTATQSVAVMAVIGGSGFYQLPDLTSSKSIQIPTPYGAAVDVIEGRIGRSQVVFLARHGSGHRIPPHKINYRANLWALHQLGVQSILSINAVGGIAAHAEPGVLVLPDQLIDYTFNREHTFADSLDEHFNHIDFTWPFAEKLRNRVLLLVESLNIKHHAGGIYGCSQGPRLETAAEVKKMAVDGCTIVGMTAMPEAALARELGMEYVSICPVVNWAAGLTRVEITLADIQRVLMQVNPLLREVIVKLAC